MKSATRNLIIVGAGVVVLGGALAALLLAGGGEEPSSSSESASSAVISLVSKQEEDIVSMKITNENGSYTIVPHTEEVETSAADGSKSTSTKTTYLVEELGDLPINTYTTDRVVEYGFSLNASKNVGEVENLADYGLKNPRATVKVTFKDDSVYEYNLGDVSAGDGSGCYMSGKGSNNVYVVSIDDAIFNSVEDFVDKKLVNISTADPNTPAVFTYLKLSGTNFEEPITLEGENSLTSMTAGDQALDPDSEKTSALTTALTAITADQALYLHPTEEQLKECGLDQPAAVIEFTSEGTTYKLMAGAKSEDKSEQYIMKDGVDVIYTISSGNISAWTDTSAFDLRTKFILLPMITDVEKLTVGFDGKDNVFELSRTKDEEKSTEDKPAYTYTVTANGKEITYENFQQYYKSMIQIQLLEPTKEEPQGDPDLTITYEYYGDTGKPVDVVKFYEISDRRYLVTVNGTVSGIVASTNVQTFLNFTPKILVDEELPQV